jgi:uncharacterized integral membrane protein (TIGR00697 family)
MNGDEVQDFTMTYTEVELRSGTETKKVYDSNLKGGVASYVVTTFVGGSQTNQTNLPYSEDDEVNDLYNLYKSQPINGFGEMTNGKYRNLFGLETSLGTILYGSTFLATDILNFKYGLNESRKTIIYGFLSMIIMTIFMILCLLYEPSINDFAQGSLTTIFSFNIRITIASLIGFGVSQFMDTLIFHKLQKKYNKLWLSNNVSTMFCQIVDTIIFTLITYLGTMNINTIIEIMFSMYIFKFFVSLLDTPFMYIASKIKKVHDE